MYCQINESTRNDGIIPGFKIQIIKCAFFGSGASLGEDHMTELALESSEFSLMKHKCSIML